MYQKVAGIACCGRYDTRVREQASQKSLCTYLSKLWLSGSNLVEYCANGPKQIDETRIPSDSNISAKFCAAAVRFVRDKDARGESVSIDQILG